MLEDAVKQLDNLRKKGGEYTGDGAWYNIKVRMHALERRIKRLTREAING